MLNIRSIILAAGKGTRMKSALPKVLHKVCGKPMIEYVLDITRQLRSLKTYVVVGFEAKSVQLALTKDCTFILQDKQLGTGDAVRRVLPNLKGYAGDVLILCGDTPLLSQEIVNALVRTHQTHKCAATILTAHVKNASGYGRIIRHASGDVLAIREDKNATEKERLINEINVGVYCFKATALTQAIKHLKPNRTTKEIYLTDAVEWLLADKQKVETLTTHDENTAFGVNTRIDLAHADTIIRRRILEQHMLQGVTIIDPATTYIEHQVEIGTDTIIYPFSYIHRDVVIGKNCSVGPFARIRSGSILADEVEIGNFTEISRSRLGKKVFMKHFSFLGDATVGEGVNIGAGSVTANYDGKLKHKTVIGDHAFIGSDSILIAPVKIGKKSIVGAGSVVTKNTVVPDGKRAVGVPAKIQ